MTRPGTSGRSERRRIRGAVAVIAVVAAGCSNGTGASITTTPDSDPTTTPAATPSAQSATNESTEETNDEAVRAATFGVAAGTEQLTVTGAEPGHELFVYGAGAVVAGGTVDANGVLLFRSLPGGDTFTVGDDDQRSDPVATFARDDHPEPSFYAAQELPTDGLGYITTRDGTTLSASVWLPGPADDGPYPTVVEYSGYSPSDPDSVGFPEVLNALGFAYVGVNMRGTGCSGGSFRFFEYAQSLDGYDVIETVAAQTWAQHHRVGMVGISYAGISQLFVAQTQPPSLSAITPFSVLDDTYRATLYPGGILNTGFAVPWIGDVTADAVPEGQQWAADRIAIGDDDCATNQLLRLQNPDLIGEIQANQYWTDELGAELAPRAFADEIVVPTFIAGAWQDEQTGGHFATMLDEFTGTEHLYASLMNGWHTDSIGAATFPRLVEFLDLYVAERTPSLTAARLITPQVSTALFGTDDVALPETDRFAGMSHDEALAAFEAEPPIDVLFEVGAADGFPDRAPMARWHTTYDAWPVPGAEATNWFLDGDAAGPGLDGGLTSAPEHPGETGYLALPDAIPQSFHVGSSSGVGSVDASFDWIEGGLGTFAGFVTEPLPEDVTIVGAGSVDLWITSNLGDTDLEVTISEVRPDGEEMYVQSGWLRASRRALDTAESTPLRPVHTHLEADAAPLPDDVELVRVELFPFAHAFRGGSRIRLTVDAPGGNRATWEFNTIAGGEQVTIAHDPDHQSKLVLPVVSGVEVPPELPRCGALRGQPCRTYSGN